MFVYIMSTLKNNKWFEYVSFLTRCLHYIDKGINRKTEFLLELVCLQISIAVSNKMK